MSLTVYFNGEFRPIGAAAVSVDDRGFLFGDGIYELIAVYGGRPFMLTEHLSRLGRSARELQLRLPDADLPALISALLAYNGLEAGDASVYIQITRGAPDGRTHQFPRPETPPTLLILARPFAMPWAQLWEQGAAVVTAPDERWGRCDIKSVNLLANVLAKQKAVDAGAVEAILVRGDNALEGSSSNLFAVREGALITHPLSTQILGGITRALVLKLAAELGYAINEVPVLASALQNYDELFITSTTMEVMPVVTVDGKQIGDGRPGPVTRRLQAAVGGIARPAAGIPRH